MMHAAPKTGVGTSSEPLTLELTHDELEALLKHLGSASDSAHVQLREKCAEALRQATGGKAAHVACTNAEVFILRQLTAGATSGPLAQLRERLPPMTCTVGGDGGGPIAQGRGPLNKLA